MPIIWEGKQYASIAECHELTGIAYSTLAAWVNKGYTSKADVIANRITQQRKTSKLHLDYAIQRKVLRG